MTPTPNPTREQLEFLAAQGLEWYTNTRRPHQTEATASDVKYLGSYIKSSDRESHCESCRKFVNNVHRVAFRIHGVEYLRDICFDDGACLYQRVVSDEPVLVIPDVHITEFDVSVVTPSQAQSRLNRRGILGAQFQPRKSTR